jgi:8-amino-3,8-dideoxy-alpha-D-manno-octulosonate transaminase
VSRDPAPMASGSAPTIGPPLFPGGGRIGALERAALEEVVLTRRLFRYYGMSDGPSQVEAFESSFASRIAVSHATAVASGTAALTAALAAAGIGPGDEVIVPAYTWVSTPASVLAVGAVPRIAEIDATLSLDPDSARALITARTRAIIAVHMRGAPAGMDGLMQLASDHDLVLLEDVAQAAGGSHRGRPLGSIGRLGTFSLQYNKIITTGEGGVVTTDDPALHERVLQYHDVGAFQRLGRVEETPFVATTNRMSELQGAVGLVQLSRLDDIVSDCRRIRSELLEAVGDDLDRSELVLRPSHDVDGDTAIALVLTAPTAAQAQRLLEALTREGVRAMLLLRPDFHDLHIARNWTPILDHRSWSRLTPWDIVGDEGPESPDSWPRTDDLLSRSVQVHINPDLTADEVDRSGRALQRIIRTELDGSER